MLPSYDTKFNHITKMLQLVVGDHDKDVVKNVYECMNVGDRAAHHQAALVHPEILCFLLHRSDACVGP